MLIFTSLCLLCWMQINRMMSEEKYTLDFYEDSIDDKFFECKEDMENLVLKKYSKELKEKAYGDAWKKEENNIKKDDKILSRNELQAIRVYTENKNGVYSVFNGAVRKGKNVYGTLFEFHMLYFLLTSAVQKLKAHDKHDCYTTYRRNPAKFDVKDKGRLGSFASSSLKSDQTKYGTETCFKIETCYGAKILEYSAHPDEEEVLIPPYEVFEIKEGKELKDCKTVFVLKSNGTLSNLNCKLKQ